MEKSFQIGEVALRNGRLCEVVEKFGSESVRVLMQDSKALLTVEVSKLGKCNSPSQVSHSKRGSSTERMREKRARNSEESNKQGEHSMKKALSHLKHKDAPAKKVRRRLVSEAGATEPDLGSPNLNNINNQLSHINKFSKEDVFKVRPKLPRSPDTTLVHNNGSPTDSPFSLATDSSDDKAFLNGTSTAKKRTFPIPKLNLQKSKPRFNAIPRPHSARGPHGRFSSSTPIPPRPFTAREKGEKSLSMHHRSHSASDLKADPAKLYSQTQFRPAPPIANRPDRSHSRNSRNDNPYQLHHQRDGPSLSRDPSRERFLGRVPSDGNLSRVSAYDQRKCHSARGPRPGHRRAGSLGYSDYRAIDFQQESASNAAVLGWENQEVVNWIISLGGDMAIYAPIFEENELTGVDMVTLNREVLKEMSIRKLGHQNRILRARDVFCGGLRLPNSASDLDQEIRQKDNHISDLKAELRNVYHVLASLQRKLEPFI